MHRRPTFLILSGAYATAEICAELGQLPPSFLPLGSERLFAHQVRLARSLQVRVCITLPDDFVIDGLDAQLLARYEVEILRVPSEISLVESLALAVSTCSPSEPVYVLHGDTMVELDDMAVLDAVAVAETDDFYSWADVDVVSGRITILEAEETALRRRIACGYFTFSKAELLLRCLEESSNFIGALNLYAEAHALTAVEAKRWLDFGHLPLFYRSRREALVARSFNSITSDGTVLEKRSQLAGKVSAEAAWYEAVPGRLRASIPQFLGSFPGGYALEYLHLPTLADLAVFGRLPPYVWARVLTRCLEVLDLAAAVRVPSGLDTDQIFRSLVSEKSRERVFAYLATTGETEDTRFMINERLMPPIGELIDSTISLISPTSRSDLSFMHGDFFFGNILFDFRSQRCKVVDPRGHLGNVVTPFGDVRYDVAKLAHSIVGRYDHLLLGYCEFNELVPSQFRLSFPPSRALDALEERFKASFVAGRKCWDPEMSRLTALLFFSATPLHQDDPVRQRRLLANGLRILAEIDE